MIRVCKPPAPPRLTKTGAARTREYCFAFDADPNAYLNGTRKFNKFKRDIYGHQSVKSALREAQHQKCCFCEGKFEAFAPADVEHYRPKGASRQDQKSQRNYPGYYWLAYSWDNLYWCCEVCNRYSKNDFFPLANPGERARCHSDDIAIEKELILNPGGQDDPLCHIRFQEEVAVGVTKAGLTTIEFVDLNRLTLTEERLTRLGQLRMLSDFIRILASRPEPIPIEIVEKIHAEFASAVHPGAEFSSMAIHFLEGSLVTEVCEELVG